MIPLNSQYLMFEEKRFLDKKIGKLFNYKRNTKSIFLKNDLVLFLEYKLYKNVLNEPIVDIKFLVLKTNKIAYTKFTLLRVEEEFEAFFDEMDMNDGS